VRSSLIPSRKRLQPYPGTKESRRGISAPDRSGLVGRFAIAVNVVAFVRPSLDFVVILSAILPLHAVLRLWRTHERSTKLAAT